MKSEKEKSFMKLYEPVHANFEKFCKACVYGEMDFQDLMHDTLLIAYKKFDKVTNPKAFLSFLFGISIRVLSNANKKNKPQLWNDNADAHRVVQSNDQTDKKADVSLLYEALSKLPESQRESILLYEIVGFSVKEIAELHQAGESAVKQRLARGRQQLIALLTEKKEQVEIKNSVV
jgi:RNA polymerase sigma-70 factor (ECF subfamily)